MNKNNIWDQIIADLESSISKSEIKTWFSATVLIELNKDLAIIQVPNKFVSTWLKNNYTDQIKKTLKDKLNYFSEIHFIYNGSKPNKDTIINKNKSRGSFFNQLNPLFTFDNFVTETCNHFAFSSALEVSNNLGKKYNPLYIFSNPSSGKTHLMNAIGNQAVSNNQFVRVIYISLDHLTSKFSLAAKNHKLKNFREYYNSGDLFLIDNIHLISGQNKLQKEFLSIFNHYYESKKQIVTVGKLPPGKIQNLMPELRSRFEWGLLSELQNPDNRTRMKIIKKTAKQNNLNIPDDAVFFLSNATDDLKTLTKYMINLEAYASLNKKEINISTVKLIIKNKHSHTINVTDIQKLTADHFNIFLTDLLSDKKTHTFSYPRHVAMYLCRELTSLSLKEIAKKFGKKDHSTIIYAVKRIKKEKEQKGPVTDDLNNLVNILS